MKCPHCAATIGIEDKFCPYCGTENPFAKQHQRDMDRYERAFENVRRDVTEKSRQTARITGPVILFAILLLLNFGALIFVRSAWDIGYAIREKQMETRADEYRDQLMIYLEAGDYAGFAGYWNANSLYMCDALEDLHVVNSASSAYSTIRSDILRLSGFGSFELSEESRKDTIDYIADQVVRLYDLESEYSYQSEKYLTEANKQALADIRYETEVLLKVWCGLTEEEAARLGSLSSGSLRDLITERMESHE